MHWRWAVAGLSVCGLFVSGRSITSCDSDAAAVSSPASDASALDDRPSPLPDAFVTEAGTEDSGAWIHLTGAPDDCEIDIPGDVASMPLPIGWVPCDSKVPSLQSCRQMKTDWPTSDVPGLGHIAPLAWGGWSTIGEPLLMFARGSGKYITRLIAEPDGAVRSAFRQNGDANDPSCVLFPYNTSGDRYAYALLEDRPDGGARAHAAVLGELNAASPRVVLRTETTSPYHPGYLASSEGLILLDGKLTLRDWSNLDASTFLGPTDEGAPGMIFPQGDAIFWASGTLAVMKHKVWTRDAGSRDFVGLDADLTHGAADLGTDGKDMVWLEGTGRASPASFFDKVTVKAAPYTTDPDQISPRTLRDDLGPYGFGGTPWIVGCGYAARPGSPALVTDGGVASGTGVEIIRLSDGFATLLANGPEWTFTTPLLVTCDEVFVHGTPRHEFAFNILRVPLASLGPWRAP